MVFSKKAMEKMRIFMGYTIYLMNILGIHPVFNFKPNL